jgi:hypothetical protein
MTTTDFSWPTHRGSLTPAAETARRRHDALCRVGDRWDTVIGVASMLATTALIGVGCIGIGLAVGRLITWLVT